MSPRGRVARWPLGTLGLSLLVAACASFTNTLAHDLAWERWQRCSHVGALILHEIRQDGGISYWYRGPADKVALDDCYRKVAAEQAQGRRALNVPEPVSSPSPQVFDGQPVSAPVWKPGDEWAYRWESPRGKGTYVWSVDREEAVDGVECYVARSGRSREIYYRRADLAYYMEKVEGAVETRHTPPSTWSAWPLTPGKTWEFRFTEEKPIDRRTNERVRVCHVEGEESLVVPAGTFRALKTVCRDPRTGSITSERWYAPQVRQWIRYRNYFSYGTRETELIAYKLNGR